MKEYCVDLEIAKELKENGFPQNCHFWHGYNTCNCLNIYCYVPNVFYEKICSAPISDEILKELPDVIKWKKELWTEEATLKIERLFDNICNEIEHVTYYTDFSDDAVTDEFNSDRKLSNSLARLWLYLKKEGYIK